MFLCLQCLYSALSIVFLLEFGWFMVVVWWVLVSLVGLCGPCSVLGGGWHSLRMTTPVMGHILYILFHQLGVVWLVFSFFGVPSLDLGND